MGKLKSVTFGEIIEEDFLKSATKEQRDVWLAGMASVFGVGSSFMLNLYYNAQQKESRDEVK